MRGDGQNQLKISAPHPITETHRLIPVLAAPTSLGTVSLNSLYHFFKHLCLKLGTNTLFPISVPTYKLRSLLKI